MIPNLDDSMSADELMEFWSRYCRPTRKDAEALIGDRRKGFTVICGILAAYACDKAVAMKARLRGDIATALKYEAHCDQRYERLPADCRW